MPFPIHAIDRAPRRTWLLPLVPASERVPEDIDRVLGEAAKAAIDGDLVARDALFEAFHPRLQRSIRRCQKLWSGQSRRAREDAIEPDDIAQEAYLVFVELLSAWRPDESLSAHLVARFSWRLNDVLRAWRRQRPGRAPSCLHRTEHRDLADEVAVIQLVEKVSANVHSDARRMLRWRLEEGLSFPEIAIRAGVSRRTVSRRWEEIVRELERNGIARPQS